MVREIKILDSDLQMLVYENYTKFIKATDTIGRMRDDVDGMEDEMQSLAATITKISEGSNRINTNLSQPRRLPTRSPPAGRRSRPEGIGGRWRSSSRPCPARSGR